MSRIWINSQRMVVATLSCQSHCHQRDKKVRSLKSLTTRLRYCSRLSRYGLRFVTPKPKALCHSKVQDCRRRGNPPSCSYGVFYAECLSLYSCHLTSLFFWIMAVSESFFNQALEVFRAEPHDLVGSIHPHRAGFSDTNRWYGEVCIRGVTNQLASLSFVLVVCVSSCSIFPKDAFSHSSYTVRSILMYITIANANTNRKAFAHPLRQYHHIETSGVVCVWLRNVCGLCVPHDFH